MSFGKMNGFAELIATKNVKDSEGFSTTVDEVLASIRVYREGRHGGQRWANLAAFSEATDLFRFRCIPGVEIKTDQILISDGDRFEIISVEDVKGRGMYTEVLAKRWWQRVAKVQMMMPEDFLVKLSSLGKRVMKYVRKFWKLAAKSFWKRQKATSLQLSVPVQSTIPAPRVNWNAPWGCPLSGWTKTATTT